MLQDACAEFIQDIPRKGEVLMQVCRILVFKDCNSKPLCPCLRQSATEIVVEQMEMIPMECVVSYYGYVYFTAMHLGSNLVRQFYQKVQVMCLPQS